MSLSAVFFLLHAIFVLFSVLYSLFSFLTLPFLIPHSSLLIGFPAFVDGAVI